MRRILFALSFILLAAGCARAPVVTYDVPDSYPEARRQQLLDMCKKGEILYRENCSACHGIFGKAKDSIPDFSTVQIDNYGARFLARDPKIHAVARKMSQEQLDQVLVFLRHRKMVVKHKS